MMWRILAIDKDFPFLFDQQTLRAILSFLSLFKRWKENFKLTIVCIIWQAVNNTRHNKSWFCRARNEYDRHMRRSAIKGLKTSKSHGDWFISNDNSELTYTVFSFSLVLWIILSCFSKEFISGKYLLFD